jgi:hypothetical protein
LLIRTLQQSGARTQMGLELYSLYVAAGLPAPQMRIDAFVGGGPSAPICKVIAEVMRSLMPAMEKFGLATAEQLDIESLSQKLSDELFRSGGVATSPALVGAWARKRTGIREFSSQAND